MFQDVSTAIPLGFFLSFLIGPVFFVLLETAATKGFRAAVSFNIGVVIADITFIGIAYLSSYQLLENLSNQPGLYVFGGAILIVYGLSMYLKKPTKEMLDPQVQVKKYSYLSLFFKGFLLNFINIGVLAFWLIAIITVSATVNNDPNRLIVFFGSMISAYFITDLGKIILAKQLKMFLTPRRIFKVKKLLGFLLVLCGIILITKGFLPNDPLDLKKGIERIENM